MTQNGEPGAPVMTGASVRIVEGPPEPHCRTPFYVRGAPGVVVDTVGRFRAPSVLAYNGQAPLLWLFRVRFLQSDLWPDYSGSAADTVEVDIYENWIIPNGATAL